ncbi:hypothetical protein JCM10207_003376 [Rhodosporidiobolus poonsookiae]
MQHDNTHYGLSSFSSQPAATQAAALASSALSASSSLLPLPLVNDLSWAFSGLGTSHDTHGNASTSQHPASLSTAAPLASSPLGPSSTSPHPPSSGPWTVQAATQACDMAPPAMAEPNDQADWEMSFADDFGSTRQLRSRSTRRSYVEEAISDDDSTSDDEFEPPALPVVASSSAKKSLAPPKKLANQGANSSFVCKLYDMLADSSIQHLIAFTESGDGFIVYDKDKLVTEAFPQYYRSTKYSSFTRQLHMYGFKRVTNAEGSMWHHKEFRRGAAHNWRRVLHENSDAAKNKKTRKLSSRLKPQPPTSPAAVSSSSSASEPLPTIHEDPLASQTSSESFVMVESSEAQPDGEADEAASLFTQTSLPELPFPPTIATAHPVAESAAAATLFSAASSPRDSFVGVSAALPPPSLDLPIPPFPAQEQGPPSAAVSDASSFDPAAVLREKAGPIDVVRTMHYHLKVYARDLSEMTSRCRLAVGVATTRSRMDSVGASGNSPSLPSWMQDERFFDPSVPLEELQHARPADTPARDPYPSPVDSYHVPLPSPSDQRPSTFSHTSSGKSTVPPSTAVRFGTQAPPSFPLAAYGAATAAQPAYSQSQSSYSLASGHCGSTSTANGGWPNSLDLPPPPPQISAFPPRTAPHYPTTSFPAQPTFSPLSLASYALDRMQPAPFPFQAQPVAAAPAHHVYSPSFRRSSGPNSVARGQHGGGDGAATGTSFEGALDV